MNINIIIPENFQNIDSQGYNEMLASEILAICKKYKKVHTKVSEIFPNKDFASDLYLYVIQYREDVMSDWLKESIKQCNGKVIVCGKSSSVERKYILQECNAYAVIMGEVEKTLDTIILTLLENKDSNLYNIKGLSYSKSGVCIDNMYREAINNLDELPFSEYEYLANGKNNYPVCVMETSRGCHGRCNFCEGYLFRNLNPGKEYRAKSADRVIEEIQYVIKKFNYRIFAFSDDNFFVDGSDEAKNRVLDFAKKIIDKKIKIRFTIECRADDIQAEILKDLKKAGLCKIFIGFESGSQSVLDRYNKGTTVEDNYRALDLLKQYKVRCQPGYILFDPYTTVKELKETVSFFDKNIDDLFSFSIGNDERCLFFPYGCQALKTFWPNETEEFYKNICYNGIQYKFIHDDVEHIYNKFIINLKSQVKSDSSKNLLQKRINCLKEALK